MREKTWQTEIAAALTIGFSLYQGYQKGVINPTLLGDLTLTLFELGSIVIPAVWMVLRMSYKKWIRKPTDKPTVKESAQFIVSIDRKGLKDDT